MRKCLGRTLWLLQTYYQAQGHTSTNPRQLSRRAMCQRTPSREHWHRWKRRRGTAERSGRARKGRDPATTERLWTWRASRTYSLLASRLRVLPVSPLQSRTHHNRSAARTSRAAVAQIHPQYHGNLYSSIRRRHSPSHGGHQSTWQIRTRMRA
jgi:hypothetical protein